MLFLKNYDAQGINGCIICVYHLQMGILKFAHCNFNGLDVNIITNLLTCVITATCSMAQCEEKCVKILVRKPGLRSILYVWHMDNITMAV